VHKAARLGRWVGKNVPVGGMGNTIFKKFSKKSEYAERNSQRYFQATKLQKKKH